MSRTREGLESFLAKFQGYLRADACGGYDGIFTGSNGTIVEVACRAHAGRKFYDARANALREANQVLEWVRQLYDIEARVGTPPGRSAAESGAAAGGTQSTPCVAAQALGTRPTLQEVQDAVQDRATARRPSRGAAAGHARKCRALMQ